MYDQTADNLGIHHFVDQDGRVGLLLQQVFDFLHEGIVDIYSRGDGGNLDIVAAVVDLDEVLENVAQRGFSPFLQDKEKELQGDVIHFSVEKGFEDGLFLFRWHDGALDDDAQFAIFGEHLAEQLHVGKHILFEMLLDGEIIHGGCVAAR